MTYSLKQLTQSKTVINKFSKVIGKRAPQFLSSVLNLANSNNNFDKVDPNTIMGAAMVAATLDLPVNPNLGYMYIIPYGNNAQAQIGYKGYIQLAQRSGLYKHLNAVSIYADEFKSYNPLTEELDYEPHFKNRDKSEVPVGYVGYFELMNGFSKTVYWTREQIDDHRKRFSKVSGEDQPTGVWKDNFDAMALKTVIRNLLSKWGPLSTEMQTAYENDETTTKLENDENNRKDVTPKAKEKEKQAQELLDQALNGKKQNEDPKQKSKEEAVNNEQGELLDHWGDPTDAK
ncbi:recombinase RecT [Ligilactobacillus cholophilus]|uniref:recombinase RecT n=1 Tax=Ligilactobacillus cholophilus TaxID=3050131 RepID=UPI0025AF1B38|nr:recombinase RecT [Ligilactobacillus cholophilus]